MSGSINKAILIGHVCREAEIRSTQSGKEIANFTLATNETWKDKTGERQEKSEFHRVSVFNEGLVKVIRDYVKKGSLLYVEGSLQTRKWQDKDGNDKYSTEVVVQGFSGTLKMLDGGKGKAETPEPAGEMLDEDSIPF